MAVDDKWNSRKRWFTCQIGELIFCFAQNEFQWNASPYCSFEMVSDYENRFSTNDTSIHEFSQKWFPCAWCDNELSHWTLVGLSRTELFYNIIAYFCMLVHDTIQIFKYDALQLHTFDGVWCSCQQILKTWRSRNQDVTAIVKFILTMIIHNVFLIVLKIWKIVRLPDPNRVVQ